MWLELLPGGMLSGILGDKGNDGSGLGAFGLDMDYESVVRWW